MDDQELEAAMAPAEAIDDAVTLARFREVILAAHPDAVPDMIAGESVAALLDSVPAAKAAYAAVRDRLAAERPSPPVVPAGAGSVAIDPAGLPTHELIRRGVAARAATP